MTVRNGHMTHNSSKTRAAPKMSHFASYARWSIPDIQTEVNVYYLKYVMYA